MAARKSRWQHRSMKPRKKRVHRAGARYATKLLGEALEPRHLLAGVPQLLGDLWLTAWEQAPPDTFLKARLVERKLGPTAGRP